MDARLKQLVAWLNRRDERKMEKQIDAAIDRAYENFSKSSQEAYRKHLNKKYGLKL